MRYKGKGDVALGIKALAKKMLDERFILHRLKSTSFALMVMIISMGLYVYYELFFNSVIRKDLIIILTIGAVSKVAAMIYYRLNN